MESHFPTFQTTLWAWKNKGYDEIANHSDVHERINQYEECQVSIGVKVGCDIEENSQWYVMVAMIVRCYCEIFVKHKNDSLYHESQFI